jgi:hypothetical protein
VNVSLRCVSWFILFIVSQRRSRSIIVLFEFIVLDIKYTHLLYIRGLVSFFSLNKIWPKCMTAPNLIKCILWTVYTQTHYVFLLCHTKWTCSNLGCLIPYTTCGLQNMIIWSVHGSIYCSGLFAKSCYFINEVACICLKWWWSYVCLPITKRNIPLDYSGSSM